MIKVDIKNMSKTEKSDYINGLSGINQILKHTFKSFYLNDNGIIISDMLEPDIGSHSAMTSLQNYIPVRPEYSLRIDSKKLFTAISGYKKHLIELIVDEETKTLYFKLDDELENIIIGRIADKVDGVLLCHDSKDLETKYKLNSDDIDRLLNKEVIVKRCDGKPMIISHKLFPNMKKSISNNIYITELDDKYFTSSFIFKYEVTNSSGKKKYSDVFMCHRYTFLKF